MMAELIERIEAADGPDRKLDLAIAHVCFSETEAAALRWEHFLHQKRGMKRTVPAFTASIDAAMMLVPEGWYAAEILFNPHQVPRRKAQARLYRIEDGEGKNYAQARACLRELALCAAAVKAREE